MRFFIFIFFSRFTYRKLGCELRPFIRNHFHSFPVYVIREWNTPIEIVPIPVRYLGNGIDIGVDVGNGIEIGVDVGNGIP